MGELRQATDAEVMGWAAAKYLEDYGEDVVITDLEDVASLVGEAAGQVHEHGAAQPDHASRSVALSRRS